MRAGRNRIRTLCPTYCYLSHALVEVLDGIPDLMGEKTGTILDYNEVNHESIKEIIVFIQEVESGKTRMWLRCISIAENPAWCMVLLKETKVKGRTDVKSINTNHEVSTSSGISSSPVSLARSLVSLALSERRDLREKKPRLLRVERSAEATLETVLSTLLPSCASLAVSSSISPCEEVSFLEKSPERSFHELNLLELPLRVILRMKDSLEALSTEVPDGIRSSDS